MRATLLEQHIQCASTATRACTAASPVNNILGGAYTLKDPFFKRATGVMLNINNPPTAKDQRNAIHLKFRSTL